MKIWNSYGSEHSMNLVLIGHFKQASDADELEKFIDKIKEQATSEDAFGMARAMDEDQRFSDEMLELFRQHKVYSLAPTELEQFVYDVRIDREGSQITVTTDEADVSAFIKLFIENGARVEIYSAHDYPNTGHGRGG